MAKTKFKKVLSLCLVLCMVITLFTGMFVANTNAEEWGEPYIPESSNGKMIIMNHDINNVKIEYRSSLDCNLVPGKKYTFKARYASDIGYSKTDLGNMFAFWYLKTDGSTGFWRTTVDSFTEEYDSEKYLYTATVIVPDDARTDDYNFQFKLGDRNAGGTVIGGRVFLADFSLIEEGTGRDLLGHLPFDEEHVHRDSLSEDIYGKKWRLCPADDHITIADKGDTFGEYDKLEPIVVPYIPESSNGKMFNVVFDTNIKIFYKTAVENNFVPGNKYTFTCRYVSDYGYAADNLAKMFLIYYYNADGTVYTRTKVADFTEKYDADKCLYTCSFTVGADARTDDYNLEIRIGDRNGGGAMNGFTAQFSDFSMIDEKTGKDLLASMKIEEANVAAEIGTFLGKWQVATGYGKNVIIADKGDTFGEYDKIGVVDPHQPAAGNGNAFLIDTAETWSNVTYQPAFNLEAGEYTFVTRLKLVDTAGNIDVNNLVEFYYYSIEKDKLRWMNPANGSVVTTYDPETCIFKATLKIPEEDLKPGVDGNVKIIFGDNGYNYDNFKLWFADMAIYKGTTPVDMFVPIASENIYYDSVSTQNKYRIPDGRKKYISIVPKGSIFGDEEGDEGNAILPDKAVTLNKVDGFVSQFVTLKPETDYAFSFRYKSESGAKAVPYIEAFSDTASLGQIACTYSKQDVDGYYNYYCEFKTPAGLKNELNVRIGVNGVKTEVVSAAAFNLYELADEATTNLLNDPYLLNTTSINAYDGTPSNAWALEGTGTVTMENIFFNIPNPQVFMFAGSKSGGTIAKEETLVAGTKYIASLNLKWGSEGNEGDTGVTLSYHNGSGWKDLTATASKADGEFKNIYTFELPADARSGKANFKITVKVGSAYVTGYISNLVITTEADKETNLVSNGDFSMGEEGWKIDGIGYKNSAAMPEGYFAEDCKVEKGMFFYRNSGTWDYFQHEYLTLKSNAYYLIVLPQVHPLDNPEDRMMSSAWQVSGKNADGAYTKWIGSIKDAGMTKWVDNVQYKHILTPDGLNATNNTKVFDIIQKAGSYGYFGDLAVYESNEKGEILSNNILLNGDLRLGTACWKTSTTDGFTWRYGKQPKDFFKNFSAHADKMVTSLGTAKNAEFGQTMTLKAETKYYFTGHYVNMNGAGVTPKAYYKNAKGKWEAMEVSFFTDSDRYYFEAEIVLSAEANAIGSGDVKLVIDNGNKGKGYLSDLTLVEDGSFVNLFADANYANGLKNWTTSKNYVISNYNQEMFKFHFDDEAFDDGNWAGETTESAFTTGAIQGYVFDENGNGYKGIKMVLDGKKSDKTDKDGKYYFGDLKPGKHELSLTSLDGTLMFIAEIEVKAGILSEMSVITFTAVQPEVEVEQEPEEEIEIEIEDTNFGIVRGYLYDVDASLLKGVKVYLGNVGETVTDENGMFQFDDVRPGKYDIYVKDTDGNISILKNVEVEAGKGAVYKVQIPFAETSTNWLVIVLIYAGAAVLVAVAIKVALVIKKKNANK